MIGASSFERLASGAAAPSRSSIDRGDVVLCNLPPYATQPWLSMGVALHSALLAEAGVRARVVRPTDPTRGVPRDVLHASLTTLTFDPSIDERLRAMEAAYRATPSFFDRILDELLRGGEEVFGLSVFRNNVDLTLQVARLIKERRPGARVVIGGPEAVESPAELLQPFVDCVVGADAERVIVPLARALLDRRPERLAELRNVWHHGPSAVAPEARAALPIPALPPIDFAPLLRLLAGEAEPTVPLLLNWGCPYHCAYCSNRSIYSRFQEGSVERVLGEMDGIVEAWRALHDGAAPPLVLQLSDATTNALPRQLDALLEAVRDRLPRWGMRPSLRGQTLFDARITSERMSLWKESGFHGTFFGLDVASEAQRRLLKRPGSVSHVREAVRTYLDAGLEGLGIGIPIGIPGETEEAFEEAARFAEWVLSLDAPIQSLTVLPFVFFQSAQDPAFVRVNEGPPRGILWRSDGPAGDPAVRARRFMALYDRIDGRAPVMSPIPPYLALPAMLPSEDPARLEAWMDRHGRLFDQIEPHERAEPPRRLAPEGAWSRALEVLRDAPGAWRLEAFEHDGAQLTVVLRDEAGARLAVLLEPHDPERRSFARTERFNVSYLTRWQGLACAFDEAWLKARVGELRASEA